MRRPRGDMEFLEYDDDDDDDSTRVTWIMGIPYTELREEERRADVFSTMWMTYRSGFPRMDPYGYTDDSGWGCMLRSAQMLMTQALQRHYLGRSWRVPRTVEERRRVPEYLHLMYLFADFPGEDNLFSIHNMCQVGIKYDKLPGEWYGPTTAACVLRDISEIHAARPHASSASLRVPCAGKPSASSGESFLSGWASEKGETITEKDTPASNTPGDEAEDEPSQDALQESDERQPLLSDESMRAHTGENMARRDRVEEADVSHRADPGGGQISASHRPLRVFVSQGDVVYIDEIEAMALRPGPDVGDVREAGKSGETSKGRQDDEQDIRHVQSSGNPMGAVKAASDSAVGLEIPLASGLGGRGEEEGDAEAAGDSDAPAFFDPLLNPGRGEDTARERAWLSAVVLLVPLRLGLDELSAAYIPGLLDTLQTTQSLGFLGGRPNHATYFFGAQGDILTGLDPHTTQATPDLDETFPTERHMHSMHCNNPASMDIKRIDPSLALAFYLPDRESFEGLVKRIRQADPPPFTVEQTRPDYEGEMGLAFMIDQRDEDGMTDDDDDDFVFVRGPER